MKDRVSQGVYILACVASGVLLCLAAFASYNRAFDGFIKLGAGIAVYYIGRDISRYRSKA
jgi:hypothetical protein